MAGDAAARRRLGGGQRFGFVQSAGGAKRHPHHVPGEGGIRPPRPGAVHDVEGGIDFAARHKQAGAKAFDGGSERFEHACDFERGGRFPRAPDAIEPSGAGDMEGRIVGCAGDGFIGQAQLFGVVGERRLKQRQRRERLRAIGIELERVLRRLHRGLMARLADDVAVARQQERIDAGQRRPAAREVRRQRDAPLKQHCGLLFVGIVEHEPNLARAQIEIVGGGIDGVGVGALAAIKRAA